MCLREQLCSMDSHSSCSWEPPWAPDVTVEPLTWPAGAVCLNGYIAKHSRSANWLESLNLATEPFTWQQSRSCDRGPGVYTVVPHYNDHLYNGNFDFLRNFIGNGSFLIKIYYNGICTIWHQWWFPVMKCIFLHIFYSLKWQKKSSNKLFANKKFQLAVNRYALSHR